MIIIGLTGSIGMGKSTASGMLRDMGLAIHCADEAVHALLAPNGDAVKSVKQAFPDCFDTKTKNIDRQKLKEIIRGNHDKMDQLEKILHPLVQASQKKFIQEQAQKGIQYVVLDIPLLFETGAEKHLDYIICVSAPYPVQETRVLSRKDVTKEDFDFFLSRQMPDDQKRQKADFVVPTGNGFEETRRALKKIIAGFKRGNDNICKP